MTTQAFTSKLFIFSDTEQINLKAIFNRKKMHKLDIQKTPRNKDVAIAMFSLLNRFQCDGLNFDYVYLVENSTEAERFAMKLATDESDYIAFLRDEDDLTLLSIHSDLLNRLVSTLTVTMSNFPAIHEEMSTVGLSSRKMFPRVKSHCAELAFNIEAVAERIDEVFGRLFIESN